MFLGFWDFSIFDVFNIFQKQASIFLCSYFLEKMARIILCYFIMAKIIQKGAIIGRLMSKLAKVNIYSFIFG